MKLIITTDMHVIATLQPVGNDWYVTECLACSAYQDVY